MIRFSFMLISGIAGLFLVKKQGDTNWQLTFEVFRHAPCSEGGPSHCLWSLWLHLNRAGDIAMIVVDCVPHSPSTTDLRTT